MDRLWFRLTHHSRADLFRLNNGPWSTDNLRIRDDAFVVEDLRIRDDSLPVDDAGLYVTAWLIDDLRFNDSLRSWHHMFVDYSSAAVDHFALSYYSRWLLDGYESRATLCRRAYNWALRHTVQVMCCVCFWDTRIAEAPRSTRRRTRTLGFGRGE